MYIDELNCTKKNGYRIRGNVYRPDTDEEKKYPTVIFSHGFGSNYRELQHHGITFAEAGINCVFYDFCGGGLMSLSDGHMQEMTVLTEAEDLQAVIREILKQPYVDQEAFFLMGESMGGFVSAYAAALLQNLVIGLILWYPAFVIPDDSRARFDRNDNTCMGHILSPDFNRTAMDIDIYGSMPAFRKPVLIIHGDQDPVVPLSYSERADMLYPDSRLVIMKGAGHGFDGEDSRRAGEISAEFVKELSDSLRGM
ncbi:MAG: alpha/beta hydrolase [Eubacterium sp.]|nr:alpha/beta hydrolase [Eubacterium sp.]